VLPNAMTQDELKQLVAAEAASYVLQNVPEGAVIGVGTGSTANCFIDVLAQSKARFRGAVSSSLASTARLESHGFKVLELSEIESLPVYVDGADEIDSRGAMIKGGGGALTSPTSASAWRCLATFRCPLKWCRWRARPSDAA
jgi:ribose 5-phosphate isomerase A